MLSITKVSHKKHHKTKGSPKNVLILWQQNVGDTVPDGFKMFGCQSEHS